MSYKIAAVPQTLVESVWHMLEPHIKRVVEIVDEETTIDTVKEKAICGDVLLLAISKESDIIAVMTLDIRDFDTGMKALFIPMLGGDEFFEWFDQAFAVVKAIAKDFGCSQIRAAGRRGWTKALRPHGWEEQYTIIKYDIGDCA